MKWFGVLDDFEFFLTLFSIIVLGGLAFIIFYPLVKEEIMSKQGWANSQGNTVFVSEDKDKLLEVNPDSVVFPLSQSSMEQLDAFTRTLEKNGMDVVLLDQKDVKTDGK